MSSHRSTNAPRVRLLPTLMLVSTALFGCGSVGPSQRTEQAGGRSFAGVECEPGLVLECEPACSRGDADACEIAGLGYLSGQAVTRDLDRARIMLERACDKGKPLACSGWAKMAEDGQGVELAVERRTALFTRGCESGDANACFRVGRQLVATSDRRSAPNANLQRAHDFFEKACAGADAEGCYELGLEAKTGRLGRKDVLEAMERLTQACDKDLNVACYELGDLQVAAGTAVHNPVRGRKNLDKACNLSSGPACAQLAGFMESGEKNVARAEDLHERACELRVWSSCLAVGRYQLDASPTSAERAFDTACKEGLVEACFEQAKLLDGSTPGAEPSPELALGLYEKACSAELHPACARAAHLELRKLNGKPPEREVRERLLGWVRTGCETERDEASCLALARWVSSGENGVTRDAKRAAGLLGPLCARATDSAKATDDAALEAHDYGEACYRLGRLHEAGQGVEQNALGAATLYEKGCSAGYQPACLSRATLQWRGTHGVKRDPEAAVASFKRLCDGNDKATTGVGADACVHLGYAQASGLGTARDLARARKQFEHFCGSGHQLACAHLGHVLVSNRGTEAERKRGEELLRSACDSANGQGCFFFADLPRHTKAQRKALLERACQLDVAEACVFERVSADR